MRVTVNGQTFDVPDGSSISVVNGVVTISGRKLNADGAAVNKVVIEGVTGPVTTDTADVEVTGEVHGDINAGGNIQCGNVGGYVDAGGNVACGSVTNYVDAGGNVAAGRIGGRVDAGGNVIGCRQ